MWVWAAAVTSLGFFPLKNEERNIFYFIGLLGRLSSTCSFDIYLLSTYYGSGTVLDSGDTTRIRQSPNLQGSDRLMTVTENNRNSPFCQATGRAMKMQQVGAWKEQGTIFDKVVKEGLERTRK